MTLTRADYNYVHRISGTIVEVLTELGTAGIRPEEIYYYTDDDTDAVCVYKRGRGN